jgi:hypothetical protein
MLTANYLHQGPASMRVTDNDNEQALRQIDDLGRRLAVLEDATI